MRESPVGCGMRQPFFVTIAALCGALGIYCSQSVVTDGSNASRGGDADAPRGPVPAAQADPPVAGASCCTSPIPKFKPLGQLTVSNVAKSQVLAVGAYREVVLYKLTASPAFITSSGLCPTSGLIDGFVETTFRPDAASPFGIVPGVTSGRLAVQGSDLQLRWDAGDAGCTGSVTYLVAGVE